MPLCPRALPVVSLSYLPTKPGLLLSLGARPAALQCVTDIRTVGSSCPREAETDRLLALVPGPLLAPSVHWYRFTVPEADLRSSHAAVSEGASLLVMWRL